MAKTINSLGLRSNRSISRYFSEIGKFSPLPPEREVELAIRIQNGEDLAMKELIESNKDRLDAIAQALIKYETLDAEEVKIILDGGELDKPTVSGLLALEQEKSNNAENHEAAADTTYPNPDQAQQDNPAEPPPIPEE